MEYVVCVADLPSAMLSLLRRYATSVDSFFKDHSADVSPHGIFLHKTTAIPVHCNDACIGGSPVELGIFLAIIQRGVIVNAAKPNRRLHNAGGTEVECSPYLHAHANAVAGVGRHGIVGALTQIDALEAP